MTRVQKVRSSMRISALLHLFRNLFRVRPVYTFMLVKWVIKRAFFILKNIGRERRNPYLVYTKR